jgi:carboxylate-amine ligase
MAALAQSLVEHLDTMIDEGRELPSRRDWVRRENKWRAARDGVQAELVIDDAGNVRPIVDDITDMVNSLRSTARALKCEDELMSVLDIARNGPSYMRQRNVIKEGGTLLDVVDLLVAEFAHDRPGG